MYNLLIADDELLIRQGLIARLSFLKLEFEEIYEAPTGLKALEIVNMHHLDIVISDIQMPDMDGLTFIEKAKEVRPHIKFIVLSGYAEFAYAEKGISLGIIAYLLKPISNKELKEAFDKTIAAMQADEAIKSVISSQNRLLEERSSYILEKEINTLLSRQEDRRDDEYYSYLREYAPNLLSEKGKFYLGIIQIESESLEHSSFSRKDKELIRFSVKNVLLEIPSVCEKVVACNLVKEDQIYAIFWLEQGVLLRDEVERIFLKMQSLFEKKMNVPLTLGVSTETKRLCIKTKKEAKEALKQRLSYGLGNIYFYEDRKMLGARNFPMSDLILLEQFIEKRDIEHIRKTFCGIFSEKQLVRYGDHYIRIMWVRVLNMILRTFGKTMDEQGGMERLLSGFTLVDEVSSTEELAAELDGILLECMNEEGYKDANARDKIRLAIDYMEQNYHKNIVINELAERYGMSPNYFSSMFKKEMNQSAVNYLTKLRVDKAAQELIYTQDSVADISRRVGYEDNQYFFRVFKKAMGMTPLMYRKEHRDELS